MMVAINTTNNNHPPPPPIPLIQRVIITATWPTLTRPLWATSPSTDQGSRRASEYLRQQLYSRQQRGMQTSLPDLPEELISMCEYLGIRVLSEPNMVWIAADALKAPLPVSWTAQRDSNFLLQPPDRPIQAGTPTRPASWGINIDREGKRPLSVIAYTYGVYWVLLHLSIVDMVLFFVVNAEFVYLANIFQ